MMTSMRMCYLLLLAAFLPIVPTVAEVVKSVSDCDQFLLEGKPPHVPGILEDGNNLDQKRYKFICQTYYDERRFLTLYDTTNKIPVFSALKYTGVKENGRPKPAWMIEPQLENENDKNKNMCEVDKDKTYNKQAGGKDYKNDKDFDRGHLIPSSYASNTTDKKSTFTLTNIVPQAITFNEGSWNRMEECIKCVMDKFCNDVTEAYVVTGAIPNNNNIQLNGKINIPSVLWSAFCCQNSKKEWIASAHWGDNVPEYGSKKKSGEKNEKKYLKTETLEELLKELKINVFHETKCPRQTTVTKFYPEIKSCSCPPLLKPLLPVPRNICPIHHNIWSTISSSV